MAVGRITFAGLSALLLAIPGTALAAGSLDCMAGSYDASQLAEIEELNEGFSLSDDPGNRTSGQISELAFGAAAFCADEGNWSEDQLYYAMLYEISRLSEAAYRASGRLTAEQMRLMDEALAKRDRPELWALLERAVIAGFNGEEAEFTRQEEFVMGAFVISSGLGTDEATGEKVGELMGIMAMMRHSRREFENGQVQE